MARQILFVHNNTAKFIAIDRDLLREKWPVREWYQKSRVVNLPRLMSAVRQSDLVVGWFASWHMFWPFVLARWLGKPTLLIIGGYDVANLPDIGYGHQRGGLKKLISSWLIRTATVRMTNSYASQSEISRNLGLPLERIRVVYHGLDDRFGKLADTARESMALTVGNVDQSNLLRKGLTTFQEASCLLPENQFVIAGPWRDDAGRILRQQAPANLTVTGWLEVGPLDDYFRRASVYVQASRHEGFGLAVAEAMLAGCIPVVTKVGALPEVAGDTGVFIDEDSPQALCNGIQTALRFGYAERLRARERILTCFSMETRRQGLWAAVEEAWQ